MKLSTKCRYGTRAMVEIAKLYGIRSAKRKDIAIAQKISHSYLENILITLKSHQLITTIRGAQGGFSLSRDPAHITLLEIVTALEGTIAPVDCLEKDTVCSRSGLCVARTAWQRLHDAQVAALNSLSLRDLVDMDTRHIADEYVI